MVNSVWVFTNRSRFHCRTGSKGYRSLGSERVVWSGVDSQCRGCSEVEPECMGLCYFGHYITPTKENNTITFSVKWTKNAKKTESFIRSGRNANRSLHLYGHTETYSPSCYPQTKGFVDCLKSSPGWLCCWWWWSWWLVGVWARHWKELAGYWTL